MFFPLDNDPPGFAEQAKAICRTCPFQTACLEYALAEDVEGVWGATTVNDRKLFRRRINMSRPTRITMKDNEYRDEQIRVGIARGLTFGEIAGALDMRRDTVANIASKLHARKRAVV